MDHSHVLSLDDQLIYHGITYFMEKPKETKTKEEFRKFMTDKGYPENRLDNLIDSMASEPLRYITSDGKGFYQLNGTGKQKWSQLQIYIHKMVDGNWAKKTARRSNILIGITSIMTAVEVLFLIFHYNLASNQNSIENENTRRQIEISEQQLQIQKDQLQKDNQCLSLPDTISITYKLKNQKTTKQLHIQGL